MVRGLKAGLFAVAGGLSGIGLGHASSPVPIDLFVASRCPDAARCETSFLPDVLRQVGSIVDLRMGFLAEVNATATYGYECMHGDVECEGNMVQLCTQKHFPLTHDIEGLGVHSWYAFVECVDRTQGLVPTNTDNCLVSLGVPPNVIEVIHRCAEGSEGLELLAESVERTWGTCGHHNPMPEQACKSCTMWLDGAPACVEDGYRWYNCTVGASAEEWVAAICKAYTGDERPAVCSLPDASRPRLVGHSYFSLDPMASASFAVKYFGAKIVRVDKQSECDDAMEVEVQLPRFDDWRGNGLRLTFVFNPRKFGGSYDVASHVKAMHVLYGNLSDNAEHQWTQFYDNHLGFYVQDSGLLAEALLRDNVPFWTTLDGGWYQSIYVVIPQTGFVVEVLGDFMTEPPLAPTHVRIGSTQQFCTPYRRRLHGRALYPEDPTADRNKTTWAAADPEAALEWVVKYMGASPILQKRGAVADGACALLKWATWPLDGGHEWHMVDAMQADWVTKDGLRPIVPFNTSDLVEYIEGKVRDIRHDRYDQFMDHAEIFEVTDLEPLVRLWRESNVPYLVRGLPDRGLCAVWANIDKNAIIVQVVGPPSASIRDECRARPRDLCDYH